MAEYVSREEAKEQLLSWTRCINNPKYLVTEDAMTILDGIPAADVVEVKHGRWEIILDDYDCEFMRCSCCGEEFYNEEEDTIDRLHNYCPNCGAKMKE